MKNINQNGQKSKNKKRGEALRILEILQKEGVDVATLGPKLRIISELDELEIEQASLKERLEKVEELKSKAKSSQRKKGKGEKNE